MAKDVSFREMLESPSYIQARNVVTKAISNNVHAYKTNSRQPHFYAPDRFADPCRTMSVDYSVFKKTNEEKAKLSTLKANYREEMRRKYKNWTKRNSGKQQFLQTDQV